VKGELQMRLAIAEFFKETLEEMASKVKSDPNKSGAQEVLYWELNWLRIT
jgi:hypothetical protein